MSAQGCKQLLQVLWSWIIIDAHQTPIQPKHQEHTQAASYSQTICVYSWHFVSVFSHQCCRSVCLFFFFLELSCSSSSFLLNFFLSGSHRPAKQGVGVPQIITDHHSSNHLNACQKMKWGMKKGEEGCQRVRLHRGTVHSEISYGNIK